MFLPEAQFDILDQDQDQDLELPMAWWKPQLHPEEFSVLESRGITIYSQKHCSTEDGPIWHAVCPVLVPTGSRSPSAPEALVFGCSGSLLAFSHGQPALYHASKLLDHPKIDRNQSLKKKIISKDAKPEPSGRPRARFDPVVLTHQLLRGEV